MAAGVRKHPLPERIQRKDESDAEASPVDDDPRPISVLRFDHGVEVVGSKDREKALAPLQRLREAEPLERSPRGRQPIKGFAPHSDAADRTLLR